MDEVGWEGRLILRLIHRLAVNVLSNGKLLQDSLNEELLTGVLVGLHAR